MVFAIIVDSIPVGFFQERKEAEQALKYFKAGSIKERIIN